jgi:hypothetical protein
VTAASATHTAAFGDRRVRLTARRTLQHAACADHRRCVSAACAEYRRRARSTGGVRCAWRGGAACAGAEIRRRVAAASAYARGVRGPCSVRQPPLAWVENWRTAMRRGGQLCRGRWGVRGLVVLSFFLTGGGLIVIRTSNNVLVLILAGGLADWMA